MIPAGSNPSQEGLTYEKENMASRSTRSAKRMRTSPRLLSSSPISGLQQLQHRVLAVLLFGAATWWCGDHQRPPLVTVPAVSGFSIVQHACARTSSRTAGGAVVSSLARTLRPHAAKRVNEEGDGDDDQDGIGRAFYRNDDSDDLAKKFYKQVEQQKPSSDTISDAEKDSPTLPPPASPARKFTGGSSSPLFSEQEPARSASREGAAAVEGTTRDRMLARETNLVSNFERTLGLQALAVTVALVSVLWVGFTGGITDGSERYFGGADEMTDETDLWNVPVPSEREIGTARADQSVFL